jgi:hypothetical protein
MPLAKFLQIVMCLTTLLQPGLHPSATAQPTAPAQVTAAAVSDDNEVLLLGDQRGTISAWRIADGTRIWVVAGAGRPIRDLGFSNSGTHVVAIEGDRFARILPATGAQGSVLQLQYQYYSSGGRPAYTVASAIVGGNKLVLGSSGYAKAFLLSADRLASELRQVVLESFASTEWGIADYMHTVPSGPPSPSVIARVNYGSNPGRDVWTDFAGCPQRPWILGTTREGYLLAWNVDVVAGLPKEVHLPTLEPEYQRRVGRTGARVRALQGVACSTSGTIATVGERSERYGEVQVWNLSGELIAALHDGEATPHAGLGRRVAWDASGEYLVTASASEYVMWSWIGGVLGRLARLSLPQNLPMPNGRPAVAAGRGKFVLLSGTGAWLYDAPSEIFVRAFGASPAAMRTEPANSRPQNGPTLLDYPAFFEQVVQAVNRPEGMKGLDHPLFRVSTNGEIELPKRKAAFSISFSCSFGGNETDWIEERADCFRQLQSHWTQFLKNKGFHLQLVDDYGLPGWTRAMMAVRQGGRRHFQYLFESETNRSETMGYARIVILRN